MNDGKPTPTLSNPDIELRAVDAYAKHRGLKRSQAREELELLLGEAIYKSTNEESGLELWRRRSRAKAVDVSARVDATGPRPVVVWVSVRPYYPRRGGKPKG